MDLFILACQPIIYHKGYVQTVTFYH